MTVVAQSLASPLACPRCNGRVDVKSPHVAIAGAAVLVYCSAECLRMRNVPVADTAPIATPPRRRRWLWWAGAGGVLAGAASVIFAAFGEQSEADPAPEILVPSTETASMPTVNGEDPRKAADEALIDELMHDAWLHPLAGPVRRMPISHSAAFGAERAGERPPECVSGHCGVDLGNEWGEPVHAVHDGVVDNVNRGPNEEHGGVFVKIAHRGGTLYSWYFHLAAVPRWIRPGTKILAGQVIGLLGDTGVFHSAPHLHFAMSVKPSNSNFERYLDPEPLIAIWPLWIPKDGRPTQSDPGMPVRAPERRKARGKRATESQPPSPVAEPAPSAGSDDTTN